LALYSSSHIDVGMIFFESVDPELYFFLFLRVLLILFGMGNLFWSLMQWRNYTLEYIESTQIISSPNARKLESKDSSKSSEQQLHRPAFQRYSLEIWQPSLYAISISCIYSPMHAFIMEVMPCLYTDMPASLVSLILGLLSVTSLSTVLFFYTNMKDRELLFQQVLREYNMKFVYPSITKMTQDEARLKVYEEALRRESKTFDNNPFHPYDTSDDAFLKDRNMFVTPEPEELEVKQPRSRHISSEDRTKTKSSRKAQLKRDGSSRSLRSSRRKEKELQE
jgi:hypothetical protein